MTNTRFSIRKCNSRSLGFSLTELLIVVAMIAVLASLALPSYRSANARSDRATALSDINRITQALERYFTYNRAYTNDFGNLSMGAAGDLTINSTDGLYTYAINNTAADNQTYSVRATPSNANDDIFILRQNEIGTQQRSNDGGLTWKEGHNP